MSLVALRFNAASASLDAPLRSSTWPVLNGDARRMSGISFS